LLINLSAIGWGVAQEELGKEGKFSNVKKVRLKNKDRIINPLLPAITAVREE